MNLISYIIVVIKIVGDKSMKNEKKKLHLGQIITVVLFLALCGAAGFFGARYIDTSLPNTGIAQKSMLFLFLILILYLACFMQIIIHEGGHLIFGLMTGYEFASFRIGSIMFVKKKDGIKVKRFSLAGTGGQCLLYINDYNDGNYPYILYNLGGSLNNLIWSVLAGILYLFTRGNRYLSAFLILFAAFGIAFAILNAVPMSGAVNNDGKNTLDLMRSSNARRCFYEMMKINALITKEVRLKDMDDELFVIPEKEYLNNALSASIGANAVSREMDKMNFAGVIEKGHYMLQNAEGLIPIYKSAVKLEIIYAELVTENSQEKVDELFDKEVKKFAAVSKKNISVIRTQYAYSLLYENDQNKAQQYLTLFEKYAGKHPHKCEVESERDLLSYAKARYDSQNSAMGE